MTKTIRGLSSVRLDEFGIDAAAFHRTLRERMQADASDFERLTGSFALWIAASLKGILPPAPGSKAGLALVTLGQTPIHGLRLNPTADTNGWYLWCGGERGTDDDFFAPLHVEHLVERLPAVVPYRDFPPGYRFVIDSDGYEDIWFDAELLTG